MYDINRPDVPTIGAKPECEIVTESGARVKVPITGAVLVPAACQQIADVMQQVLAAVLQSEEFGALIRNHVTRAIAEHETNIRRVK